MGANGSKDEIKVLKVQKEYCNVHYAFCDPTGKFAYVVLKDQVGMKAISTIGKIDMSTDKSVEFFPNNILFINKILVSNCSKHIVIQSDTKSVIYDTGVKKSTIMFEFSNSFTLVNQNFLFIQSAPTTIIKINLQNKLSSTHKLDHLKCCRVQTFCVSPDSEKIYAVGPMPNSDRHMILKYDCAKNTIEELHKSKKSILKLEYCDKNKIIICSKTTGTISIYDIELLNNKKNLRFSGALIDFRMLSEDPDRLAACYEVNFDIAFVIWNVNTLVNEKVVGVMLNLIDSRVNILYADNQKFSLLNGNKVLFFDFGSGSAKESEKKKIVWDENMLHEGLEPVKFNSLVASRDRRERNERTSIYADDLKSDIRFNAKFIKEQEDIPLFKVEDTPQVAQTITPKKYSEEEEKRNEPKQSVHKSSLEESYHTKLSVSQTNLEESRKLCFVCAKNPSDVIFYPCKHNVICKACVKGLGGECIVCSGPIQRKSLILISPFKLSFS
jgi:hypothetical protein